LLEYLQESSESSPKFFLGLYYLALVNCNFACPHRKKSMGFRSYDLGGNVCGPPRPIHRSGIQKGPVISRVRSVGELYREKTGFVGVFVGQYSLTARPVHLAVNADTMHL
jgi:hypothetical protein